MHTPSHHVDAAQLQMQLRELEQQNARLSDDLLKSRNRESFQNIVLKVLETSSIQPSEAYGRIVGLLPSIFMDPDHLVVYLSLAGADYGDARAKHGRPCLSFAIKEAGTALGTLWVGYHADSEMQFLQEERDLLAVLVQLIAAYTIQNFREVSPFQESRNHRALYASLTEVLFEISLAGEILFVSEASNRVLGYDPHALMGTQLFLYIHPDDLPKISSALKTRTIHNSFVMEFRFLHPNGQSRWCRSLALPVLQQEKIVGFQGILTDIDDAKSARLALDQSTDMLDILFQSMNQGVVYHDGNGTAIKANPAAMAMLGLSLEQMNDIAGIDPQWHLIHEDGSEILLQDYPPMKALETGEKIDNEIMGIVKSPSDSPTWVLVSAEPEFQPGLKHPYRVFTTFTNITTIKEMEKRITAQMAYSRSIIDAIPDGILIIDGQGLVLDYKPSIENRQYLSRETFVNHKMQEVLPDLDISCVVGSPENQLPEGVSEVSTFELMIGGVLHFHEARISRLSEDRFVIVVRDNTLRQKSQQELEESNRKLKVMMNNLKGVAYRCRMDAYWTMEFLSGGILELTGYEPSDFLGNQKRSYESIIHEDDRAYVRNVITRRIETRSPYTLEYRIIAADDTCKWVWEKGQGYYDKDNQLFLEGFISDITDRKMAEQRLSESEETYRSLVESLDGAIVIMGPDGTYQFVNSVFAKDFGKTKDEMIGLTIDQLFLPEEVQQIRKNIERVMRSDTGMVVSAEPHIVDGKQRWFRISMQPIHDEGGKIKSILIASSDITMERETFHCD